MTYSQHLFIWALIAGLAVIFAASLAYLGQLTRGRHIGWVIAGLLAALIVGGATTTKMTEDRREAACPCGRTAEP